MDSNLRGSRKRPPSSKNSVSGSRTKLGSGSGMRLSSGLRSKLRGQSLDRMDRNLFTTWGSILTEAQIF